MTTSPCTENNPKNAIQLLLQKAKIQKIAYIDDRFSINQLKDEFIGNLKFFKSEELTIPKLDSVDWNAPMVVFLKSINRLWDGLSNPERYLYIQEIYNELGKKDELINIHPVTDLANIIPEYLKTFSPEEWERGKDDFFNESLIKDSDRILCLFDMELKTDDRDGLYYLQEILSNPKISKKTYCALFSHLVTIGLESEIKKEWCLTRSIPKKIADKFYPISKASYSEIPLWHFIEGLKNVLIVSEVERLKKQSKTIIKSAQKKVVEELKDLNPETYNHIIQRSSNIEGTWEMNTLFRISSIMQDCALKTAISNSEIISKFNSSITKIRSFEEVKLNNEHCRIGEQATKLREKEVYEDGKIINFLHYPLSNGDIFQIGSKEYVLLVQPCNLAIRPGGKRNFDFAFGNLILLSQCGEKEYFEKLQIETDSFKYANFSIHPAVKLDILDLSIYNADGICAININEDLPECSLYHPSLINRFHYLNKEFSRCASALDMLHEETKRSKHIKEIIGHLKPTISLSKISGLSKNPYDFNSKKFDFGIKRIKRLKDPFSNDLLQKFMLYLSRNGFGHDFSK